MKAASNLRRSDLEQILGDRAVVVGRELTKMYEELRRGPVSQVRQLLQDREVKGEVALLVAGWDGTPLTDETMSLAEEIRLLEKEGLSLKEIAQTVSERRRISKREVYTLGIQLKEGKQ